MAAKILNIEVSDRLIKVCCTVPKRHGSQVLSSFMFPTPEGCVSDGLIEDPDRLGSALRAQLDAKALGSIKNVIFAVSSAKIATREVKLPPLKDKQLPQIIATNAGEYFPVDLGSYHVTYSLLERTSGKDAACRVLVMAAPISLLEAYFKLAEAAGLNIKAIDNGGNSQYQALRGLGVHETTMFVDIDCTGSFVSFIQDDKLLLQRIFAFGGDELVSHYMSSSGKNSDQYLEALNELTIGSPSFLGTEVLDEAAIEAGLERLIGSIVRSADYFNSSRWETGTQQVVLMGTCSHLVGLKELVAAATGLPTIYFEELAGASALAKSTDNAYSYITCIGAGLLPVNLMPDQFTASGKAAAKPESLVAGVVICGIMILAAMGFGGLSLLNYFDAQDQLEQVNTEIASLQPAEDAFLTYLAYQQGEEAIKLISDQTQQPNGALVEFFVELEAKMPSSISLLSAVCTNEGVSMNLTVASFPDAASVIKQLRSFESISIVDVSSVARTVNEAGIARFEFSVNCVYGLNPYLNGINPYEAQITPPEEIPTVPAEPAE